MQSSQTEHTLASEVENFKGTELREENLLELWRMMLRIRRFEETVEKNFLAGEIPGFVHLSIGQEAVAAGICAVLGADDYITSTHRGHGHTLAKGARMDRMMAELYGRATGYCKGKGGSMHIADFTVGMLGANGIVAGGFNLAIGAGMSIKLLKNARVAVCFFGDGAANRGPFHEALNWASAYHLPVIFVCEHNGYASTTASKNLTAVENIVERAGAYRMPAQLVNGNDVVAVYQAGKEAVFRARKGGGPSLIEAKTYRIKGHYVGDPVSYREKQELEEWQSRDPLQLLQERLLQRQTVDPHTFETIREEVEREVEEAVDFARTSPWPDAQAVLADLFIDMSH